MKNSKNVPNAVEQIFSAIAVPRYVCTDCGYAEEWVDKSGLYPLKDKLKK